MWQFITEHKEILATFTTLIAAILGVVAAVISRKKIVIHHDAGSQPAPSSNLASWFLLLCIAGMSVVLGLAIILFLPSREPQDLTKQGKEKNQSNPQVILPGKKLEDTKASHSDASRFLD